MGAIGIRRCDHKSVGIVVSHKGRILLIERAKPPYGYAAPAGHVDEHGSFYEAALSELYEEVGLSKCDLTLLREGCKKNPCRRPGGTHHYWKIYGTEVNSGVIAIERQEVKSFIWATSKDLARLAARTERYLDGNVSDEDWNSKPGLEPVWKEWFCDLGLLRTA